MRLFIPAPMGYTKTGRQKALWLSSNQRIHWAQRSRLVKQWRMLARTCAQAQKLPKGLQRVHITVEVHRSRRGRADAHNVLLTAKSCIDGLVDYGLIPDDNDDHLLGPDMRAGEPGKPGMTFTIEEIP
ncbi:RusA family crossover junction endodeoxyribonuclease [Sediminivirga luteola]|uniref:Uncharacterized protein n=1 Tax=Sediminivirga luteola TaxID=1774748 RepID=A0A8J2TXB5_9MICO|nr:hypothetical protein [Sediminivirga luteola]GGA10923.1 hypothetical protein GCM10011333_12180 [Sediminivirga luteola]